MRLRICGKNSKMKSVIPVKHALQEELRRNEPMVPDGTLKSFGIRFEERAYKNFTKGES